MKRVSSSFARALVVAGMLAFVPRVGAQINGLPPGGLDHLQCYQIRDSLPPGKFEAELRNQFGLDAGCILATPARLLCAETSKRITSDPQPPGGGPAGDPAGHFLCYFVRCPQEEQPAFRVEDQFGRRPVKLDRTRLLCAPANKLICGDGELDPGEACDPSDPNNNTCPNGDPCSATCTCPPGECCQCDTSCFQSGAGQACPTECTPASGLCSAAGVCEDCICGDECTADTGVPGHCRPTGSAITDPCRCVADPVDCVCGTTCTTPNGDVGQCRPVPGTNVCRCVPPPPNDCVCGEPCTARDGTVGSCRPTGSSNVCRCEPPPPPPDCPCDTSCTLDDGTVGLCRHVGGSDRCRCVAPPPPPDCPCGAECVDDDNNAGICRQVAGAPGVCACRAIQIRGRSQR